MDEENKIQGTELVQRPDDAQQVHNLIDQKVKETEDVKVALDLLATKTALGRQETRDKVVEEKQEELRNDAEAKRVQAETERIAKEAEKARREKERELAELDRIISTKKAEVDRLQAESDIASAFFNSNKDILKYIGVREKKSLRTMQVLMAPAIFVFILVQVLLFPLTFCGLLLETIVSIIGGVCKAIQINALKIIVAILVVVLLVGVGFCAYYFGIRFLTR